MSSDQRGDERDDERAQDQEPFTGKSEAPSADDAEERVLAEWRIHLFMRDVRKSIIATVGCTAVLVLLSFSLRSALLTILGAFILFGSLSDLYLPITFRLTTRGAFYDNVIFRKRMVWDDVRAAYISGIGVKLSPFSAPTRREAFRGILLRFSGLDAAVPGNRDQVVQIVKERATKRR
ncbi:MAG: hypothetical protein JW889_06725 [Verrucomicrobia bacterium]|nr:hypothetical protein [Verrucomicrobiota bacterium]